MAKANTDHGGLERRWRSYFEQILVGGNREVEAATRAAMQAVSEGRTTDQIRATGLAAARAVRAGGSRANSGSSGAGAPPRTPPPRSEAPRTSPKPAEDLPPTAGRRAASGRSWPAGSAIVQGLEKRSESMDGEFFQVWSMRLFRLQDRQAVPPPIPVEIRGRAIVGALATGDVVVIPDGPGGRTRVVKSLHNLTTESVVEARGRPFRRMRTVRRTFRFAGAMLKFAIGLALLAVLVGGAVILLDQLDYL